MGRVRKFLIELLYTKSVSVNFDVSSKNVDGFNFYLGAKVDYTIKPLSTIKFFLRRYGDYICLQPQYGFGIFTNDKIDLADSEDFLCDFDGDEPWDELKLKGDKNTFQDKEHLDLHVRYDIPRWVKISYTRFSRNVDSRDPLDPFNLHLYWHKSPDVIKVSTRKVEKLFENSENLEQDVLEYLRKSVINPTIEYYKKLVAYIFNSDILETIVKIIQELSNS